MAEDTGKPGKHGKPERIIVMGVGNTLLTDEAVGVKVIEELRAYDLPDNVQLVDGGTGGLDLIGYMSQADRMIVVDAVDAGKPPGSIFRFTPQDVEGALEKKQAAMSLHDVGLIESFVVGRQLGHEPDVVIIGIQPKDLTWGMELTPEVAAKVPRLIELVLEELGLSGSSPG